MDTIKVATTNLEEFIRNAVVFEMPLFHNNPGKSVKFDFEQLTKKEIVEIISKVLLFLFEGNALWICEWGSKSGDTIRAKKIVLNGIHDLICIPYQFLEDDYYSYESDSITCVYSHFDHFNISEYLDYVLETNFISNLLCLVSIPAKTAVHIYDRRGMDIVSTDVAQLMDLRRLFGKHFSNEWLMP